MDHPVVYVAHRTKFLDSLIQEQEVSFVVWLVILCLLVIVWIFARQRKRPIQRLQVARLLPGIAPGPEPDPESSAWEEHFDP
jgi:cbb3-type cytochrome oxidase subunit 3